MNPVEAADSPLRPCPPSPNCVCSLAADEAHHIEPLVYTEDTGIWNRLKEMIEKLPRTKRVEEREDYLHYEFKTRLMRFKDDVEIWHDRANRTLHFRSASRVGYSDLGTNRRRIEKIKELLSAH